MIFLLIIKEGNFDRFPRIVFFYYILFYCSILFVRLSDFCVFYRLFLFDLKLGSVFASLNKFLVNDEDLLILFLVSLELNELNDLMKVCDLNFVKGYTLGVVKFNYVLLNSFEIVAVSRLKF